MAKTNTYDRLAWEDRFNMPDVDSLREAIPQPNRRLFDLLRKHLLQMDSTIEQCAWYGDCWRWSIEYRSEDAQPEDNLLALLIPCPEDFQLAIPIEPEFVKALPMRQFKRAVRDGLDLAAEPFHTRWGIWSVQHANLAEELTNLLTRKFKHVLKKK